MIPQGRLANCRPVFLRTQSSSLFCSSEQDGWAWVSVASQGTQRAPHARADHGLITAEETVLCQPVQDRVSHRLLVPRLTHVVVLPVNDIQPALRQKFNTHPVSCSAWFVQLTPGEFPQDT